MVENKGKMVEKTELLFKRIGAKVCELRKIHGLTQHELCLLTDVKRATIANIESGRQQVTISLLYRIATALQTEVTTLLPTITELNTLASKEENKLKSLIDDQEVSEATKNTILQLLNI